MSTSELTYQSKAIRLSEQLLKDIHRNEYVSGTRLPAEQDLARKYQVSRPTIRRALDILAGKQVVVKIPQKGVVVGNGFSRKPTIGQIAFVPHSLNGDTNRYVKGMMEAMDSKRFTLAIYSSHADIEKYRQNMENILKTRPAGIITTTMPEELCQINAEVFTRAGIPVVTIGHAEIPGFSCDRIDEPGTENARKIAQFILKKGYRDIAYVGTSPRAASEQTIETLRAELLPAGLWLPEENVFIVDAPSGYVTPPQPYADTLRFMTRIFKEGFRCELLVAGYDYAGVGVILAAMSMGIKIPQDLKIVSAMRCAAEEFLPMRLTTVDFNPAEEGRIAMKLLTRRIDGYKGPIEVHHTAVELIEGDTT